MSGRCLNGNGPDDWSADPDCCCWACLEVLHLKVLRSYAYARRRAAEQILEDLEAGDAGA
jgi:hypothetical protein